MSQEMGMAQMAESTFGKICEHGQLARKCDHCELEKMYQDADVKDKRIAKLSADLNAFAAALVCRRHCKTCGGVGRVTGNTISYETDTEEERRDAWIMGSRRCPDCGQKPEVILAAHDASKDARIAELESQLQTQRAAAQAVVREVALVQDAPLKERIAELEAALARLLTCSATTHACAQCAVEAQAALDAARKVQP
jgi:hypothetical protein